MSNKKLIPILVGVAITIGILVAIVGLPFDKFGVDDVDAQYAPPDALACSDQAEYQIRFYGDVTVYEDSALNNPVLTVQSNPTTNFQKFLVCPNTLNDVSVQVNLGGALVWVPVAAGEIVPRGLAD